MDSKIRWRTILLWFILGVITIVTYNVTPDTGEFYYLIFVELWLVVALFICFALGILLSLSYMITALIDFFSPEEGSTIC